MFSTIFAWLHGMVQFLSHLLTWHAFGVLALLPGGIAVLNQVTANRNFNRTKLAVDKIAAELKKKGGKKRSGTVFVEMTADSALEDYRPRMTYTLLGALFLTAVFEVVAAIGGTGGLSRLDLGVGGVQRKKSEAGSERERAPASQVEQQEKACATEGETRGGDSKDKPGSPTVSGLAGLVYAGYGAYIYTLILVISRLNSSALTGKFLAVSSVRSAIALILGFTAADTNIFSGLTPNQALFVLFFIGLFPSWAMDALRRKAQEIFKPRDGGCDVLPICLIDGLDDGIADRLAEVGVWDIQHIAVADPFVFAAKTLYPIRRIIDWMDQAILISYVRSLVTHFRAVGVRGAIDFAALYRDAMTFAYEVEDLTEEVDKQAYRKKLAERATEIIKALGQKTGLSEASLYSIGRSLYEDAVVDFIWELWFDTDEPSEEREKVLGPPAPPATPPASAPAPPD